MTEHFNKLTPAQDERLACLAEECSEVIQAVTKIQRHGYESYHPDNPKIDNRELLEKEIGDVIAIIDLLLNSDDISDTSLEYFALEKNKKLPRFTHHQDFSS